MENGLSKINQVFSIETSINNNKLLRGVLALNLGTPSQTELPRHLFVGKVFNPKEKKMNKIQVMVVI